MESALRKTIDEIMSKPGVTGLLCADNNGLCLASKGTMDSSLAGTFVHLAKQASLLEPGVTPVVRLEGENSDILIHQKKDLTLSILRTQK